MTAERSRLSNRGRPLSGPLGRRLLAAFVLVALSSVAVLTIAALVATNRGLASVQQAQRQQITQRVAAAAGTAYAEAGNWTGAQLAPAAAVADGAGARLVVLDAGGGMVWPGRGAGAMAGMHQSSGNVMDAPVTAAGQRVGTIRLAFPTGTSSGRDVAWSWIGGAALVALVAALLASAYVAGRLARPLVALTTATRRFAAGDRTARAAVSAPGELGEVAHAFDTMAEEVVRAERVRRQLAADVAHELRTPLAALQAGLEELRDGLRPADPHRLATLHDQTLRLGRVVEDLADLSAAEAAALSLHPVDADLAAVARDALAAQQPQLDAAGLTVPAELNRPVPVRADPDRLHQAITNLLANATRYCRSGDQVHLRARVEPAGGALLTVADTGPGIPAEELPHAFERLFRGRDARDIAGSGIGLAVVRELITAHGGVVALESPPGEGLTVTIRLPARSPAAAG
ncbi:sensor histidine kinase [Micromonospora aurantiaca]|uniref:HAMP domain-containing sensor histidine kinase n=1 Tax=Micromonospora aurantiaca (nom. illeg.) TaxID=47850 RepID=UPI001E53132C|nr:HAMP domain-containing sensor histidine kinase [Micromonospora aurantiaca]UFN96829.1 HAMP domain-containing histidine kinase [Micromonospora aurantiaca]